MTKKQKLQAKLEKMLKEFNDGHKRLEKMKAEMFLLRKEIKTAPNIIDERDDELKLKGDL